MMEPAELPESVSAIDTFLKKLQAYLDKQKDMVLKEECIASFDDFPRILNSDKNEKWRSRLRSAILLESLDVIGMNAALREELLEVTMAIAKIDVESPNTSLTFKRDYEIVNHYFQKLRSQLNYLNNRTMSTDIPQMSFEEVQALERFRNDLIVSQ
ncbi:unnamed protein product [Auanema sp. JU1783]|nr:unnamed protein product [Auanema sp. JU1783]